MVRIRCAANGTAAAATDDDSLVENEYIFFSVGRCFVSVVIIVFHILIWHVRARLVTPPLSGKR